MHAEGQTKGPPCSTADDCMYRCGQIMDMRNVSRGCPASASPAPPTREGSGALCCVFLMEIFVRKYASSQKSSSSLESWARQQQMC